MDDPLQLAGAGYSHLRSTFPLVIKMQRQFAADFAGPIFVWDLDKTYLNTRFSQMRHLLRIPFELGIDKKAVRGTPELLHALRDGVDGCAQSPIFFVSASPHQLSTSVERKMLLDGIQCDGIVFKDATHLMMRGEFSQLRFQVAYKLAALTTLLCVFPVGAELHLFGDDVEDDALIYAIFADLASGRLAGDVLHKTLLNAGVPEHYAQALTLQAADAPKWEAVAGIYIRLTRAPDGSRIRAFHPGVIGWETPVAVVQYLHQRQGISPRNYEAVVAASEWSEARLGEGERCGEGFWTPASKRSST